MIRLGAYGIDLDKRRPVVVPSSDDLLGVDVWQTHAVPLTSNLDRAGLAGNVLLPAEVTGLPKASVAVPLGLELVSRPWLKEEVGRFHLGSCGPWMMAYGPCSDCESVGASLRGVDAC